MFIYCKEWMTGHIYIEELRKKKKKKKCDCTWSRTEIHSIQYNMNRSPGKEKKTLVSWSKRSLVLQQEENGILMCPTKWTVNKGNLLALLSANLQPKKQRSLHLPMSVCCQWTIYHDCQNKFGSLLYNERSWISRFATCQSISRAWMHLQSTSPVGNSHHQLSSLWHHEYLS